MEKIDVQVSTDYAQNTKPKIVINLINICVCFLWRSAIVFFGARFKFF